LAVANLPLYTSIPAGDSRINSSGEDVGPNHQRACVGSWEEAGFDPVTVNGPAESPAHGVRQIKLPRDASEVTGRPHIYLGDLIAAIRSDTDGPYALMNADIAVPPSSSLAQQVAAIKPGGFMFARRRDTNDLTHDPGIPYSGGFDFFAGHTRDLGDLDTGFVFGMPWWDHYLPLSMLMRRRFVVQLAPQLLHLRHGERWEPSTFDRFGRSFISAIRPVARGSYRWHLWALLRGATGGSRSALAATLRPRDPARSPEEWGKTLSRIADLNVHYLDHQAPISAAT
jgi:hypothetical protein